MKVFVRGLRLDAEIGIHDHELGRSQPLVIDVELGTSITGAERLADTIDYEWVVACARRVVGDGHAGLVESVAERLARACLEDDRVFSARVRVEKPEALAPHAAGAGAEITLIRD